MLLISDERSTAKTFSSFPDFLASTLRVGTELRVYHISTPTVSVPPIFAAAPERPDEPTTCETHFLAVAQQLKPSNDDSQKDKSEVGKIADPSENDYILVLGVEVLVFSTASLTTVFVSKADSTGFLSRPVAQGQGASSIIRTVIAAFLEWLVAQNLSPKISESASAVEQGSTPPQTIHDSTIERQIPISASADKRAPSRGKKLVLSLFARSQNQYLFPGSVENKTKHVLDDRQLIKWWCRLLDELVQKDWPLSPISENVNNSLLRPSARSEIEATPTRLQQSNASAPRIAPVASVVVPGQERAQVIRAFVPTRSKGFLGDGQLTRWAVDFPAQFLTGTNLHSIGSQLPVRCAIPRFPDDPKARYCDDLDGAGIGDKGHWRTIKTLDQFWETMEYRQECAAGRLVGFVWVTYDTNPVGNTAPDDDRVLALTAEATQTQTGYVESTDIRLEPARRASKGLVPLTVEQYVELSDLLINETDLAGSESATKSTKDWVAKLKQLSGLDDVGLDIEGQLQDTNDIEQNSESKKHTASNESRVEVPGIQPKVNELSVKKRKRNAEDVPDHKTSADEPKVLSAGLVKKKSKLHLPR